MISLNDVLLAMSNIPVDDPIAEIWGRQMQGGYKIIEYTGELPITINANGDMLLDYRIYGADGGVGEPTENLFNINRERSDDVTFDTSKYIYGARADSNNRTVPTDIQSFTFNENNFTVLSTGGAGIGFIVKVKPSTTYSLSYRCDVDVPVNRTSAALNRAKADGTLGAFWGIYGDDRGSTFETDSDTEYVFIVFRTINQSSTYSHIMLVEGSTAPTTYAPYGYKLPTVTRNENLFNPNDPGIERGYYYGYNNSISTAYGDNSWESGWIPVTPGDYTFYLKRLFVGFYFYVNFYNSQKEFVKTIVSITNPNGFYTRTISDYGYVRFNGISAYSTDWLVARGTVTTYIPYSRTDTPVYIGENQLDSVEGVSDYVDKASGKIVRKIGEYTFTGDESFNKYGNSDVFYTSKTIDPVGITTVNTITMRCNHPAFTAIENKDTRYWLNPEADNVCCFLPGGMSQVFLRSTSNFTTVAECQAYLKSQYDNGTPVKISYWLKTPVEEDPPVLLPDIPTIEGETIIDYDGTPKPSKMYVKYKDKAVQ